MTRTAIDFDAARSLTGATFLFHGNYGSGKTYLLGDALRTEAQEGPVLFLNIRGEDGYLSIADLRGDNFSAETVDAFDDVRAVFADARKNGVRAVGIDGLHRLYGLAYVKALGSNRIPVVGGSKNEWSDVHKLVEDLIDEFRYFVPFVLCTSATDKSVDQIKGETHTTPNFPGRNAAGIAGHFDYVFFLDSEVLGPSRIRRKLLTAPVSKMVVRYRLPKPLPTEIIMPEGPGGWALVKNEILKALAKA